MFILLWCHFFRSFLPFHTWHLSQRYCKPYLALATAFQSNNPEELSTTVEHNRDAFITVSFVLLHIVSLLLICRTWCAIPPVDRSAHTADWPPKWQLAYGAICSGALAKYQWWSHSDSPQWSSWFFSMIKTLSAEQDSLTVALSGLGCDLPINSS